MVGWKLHLIVSRQGCVNVTSKQRSEQGTSEALLVSLFL